MEKGAQLIENGRAVTEQELAAELRAVDEQIAFHQSRLRSFDAGTGVVAAKGNEERPVYAIRIADVDNDDKIKARGSIDSPQGISVSFNGPDVHGRDPFLGTVEIQRNDNGEVVLTMALDTRVTLDGVTYGIKMFPDVANPDGIPTGVGDAIPFTQFALDRAMEKYRKLGHGDVDVLGGSLADDNKVNFQLEYAAAIQAGLGHDAALQQAARNISFGKHRMERGYTELDVRATGNKELRDVLSPGDNMGRVKTKDGREITNFDVIVPTRIEIDARKPKLSTTKL